MVIFLFSLVFQLSRAFDHICMEKARYKFLIIIINYYYYKHDVCMQLSN